MMIIDYADYNDLGTQDYIKNNFIIDYAASTDYQDHLKNCFTMTTLTTLIYCLLWLHRLRWFQLYEKNNFIIDYTDCVVMKDYYW